VAAAPKGAAAVSFSQISRVGKGARTAICPPSSLPENPLGSAHLPRCAAQAPRRLCIARIL